MIMEMLAALFRRDFASKCKPRIKAIKERIELIRRRRRAMENFLKKDIADLIAGGHYLDAYGRAERLFADMIRSACFDFVDECCDLVSKNLSVMKKQSECPEECQAAVASLMYAAAWLADLPELRYLRATFQEKYGYSLQDSVDQKFAEDLSSPPSTEEKRIQLIQDIAEKCAVSWNSIAFEEQRSAPSLHDQPSNEEFVPGEDKDEADRINKSVPVGQLGEYSYGSEQDSETMLGIQGDMTDMASNAGKTRTKHSLMMVPPPYVTPPKPKKALDEFDLKYTGEHC